MANINGGSGNDGATVVQGTDANGTPLTVRAVTVTNTPGVNLSGTNSGSSRSEFDVNMGSGNDTLVGQNMVWVDERSRPDIRFDEISMGLGNDSVSLFRSAFRSIDMGSGNDTLVLELSGGRSVNMGTGNDEVRLGGNPDATVSDAELAQKAGQPTLALDGGNGIDTLNLQGSWTLTLSSGNVTMDTNGDGVSDRITNVYSNSDVRFIIGYPTVLSGAVDFGTATLANGTTIPNRVLFSNFELINAVCFTAGTLVDTPKGQVAIETLREGDLVITRNGPKALSWIGKRTLDSIDLAGNPKLLPVRVPAGAFGNGLPTRDVSFSPQHRVVIRSSIAERMFGSSEVLVSVKQLVGVNGIDVDGDVRSVQYFHLMFQDHQILSVEGIEAESLYPGKQAISFLTQDQLTELRAIFPNFDALVEADAPAASAIPFLKGRESRTLAARHAKNDRPLYA
ncbi:Hint domain-containing protein [Paracoccus hibiscisoli]|uniref:Hint domain-containing protein n=1 Tax=Paracoccus hibiscisoli TaxID=2023261 RepID=A0A4U0QZR5_9RHOB|nr:Hint domain-containing protein [Paracoccus hibiscisoli]TJZ87132.1 Hint domain-containing protein [Paracoccus hibiscisoli]